MSAATPAMPNRTDEGLFTREMVLLRFLSNLLPFASSRSDRLSILIYHRVLEKPDPMYADVIDAAAFRWQMDVLVNHFNVLPLSVAVALLEKRRLPPRAACVTFDDGYADNVHVALPILRERGISATFFIATGFLDGGQMWNDTVFEALRQVPDDELDLQEMALGRYPLPDTAARVRAAEALIDRLKYLPLEERLERCQTLAARAGLPANSGLMMCSSDVRRLVAEGMEVGGHTINHPILAVLDPATARREIADNRDQLAALVEGPVRLFAYPNGKPGQDYLPEHVEMVRDLGYRAAVSTSWGLCTGNSHRWQLPRFTPWDATPIRFLARMVQNTQRPA